MRILPDGRGPDYDRPLFQAVDTLLRTLAGLGLIGALVFFMWTEKTGNFELPHMYLGVILVLIALLLGYEDLVNLIFERLR